MDIIVVIVSHKRGSNAYVVDLRLADCKHSSIGTPATHKDVKAKAADVYNAIAAKLPNQLHTTLPHAKIECPHFQDEYFVVVTNVKDPDALSPLTFDWYPWSDYLFLTPTSP